jgi:hypothetical protein
MSSCETKRKKNDQAEEAGWPDEFVKKNRPKYSRTLVLSKLSITFTLERSSPKVELLL